MAKIWFCGKVMSYYLGVDGGGTHTRFVIYNDKGNEIKKDLLESIHILKVGYEGIVSTLSKYANLLKDAGYNLNDFKVAMGLAGYGNDPVIRKSIEEAVWSVFPGAFITNDADFARRAALNNRDGIYVISGTGSIAFKVDDGVQTRRGGFGYLLADEGSAYWIGKKVLALFTQEADGRTEKTSLYQTIMDKLGLQDPYGIIAIANSQKENYRNWVAEMAELTSHCLDCEHLKEAWIEAGVELANLANSFKSKNDTLLSYGGGVLLNNEIVRKSFLDNLDSNLLIVHPNTSVEYAAYLIYNNS